MGQEIDHKERKHALLSASGASRWLNCPPSARLEEMFQESAKSSDYAEEGTLAHEFGELSLRSRTGQITRKVFMAETAKLTKSPRYSSEMEGEVEKYSDYVFETYLAAREKVRGAILLIEERLDFSHLVEQGFGTGDAIIISDGVLEIIDLKYGKGIRVDAEKNPQLMLYGLGALAKYDIMFDVKTVRLTIVHPRLDHYSSWDISVDELVKWGEETVKPIAARAYLGEGVQKAGPHCRWCKVQAMCATLAANNVSLAQYEFKSPYLLTEGQLLEVHKQIPMLTDWANAVEEYLLKEALNGKQWEGLKVVEGRSQRKWLDKPAVAKILLENKYSPEQFMVSDLAGIPAIEKLVGKKEFPVLLGECVAIPQGKPTLVPISDKRPAMGVDQAKIDFSSET